MRVGEESLNQSYRTKRIISSGDSVALPVVPVRDKPRVTGPLADSDEPSRTDKCQAGAVLGRTVTIRAPGILGVMRPGAIPGP
jgi:hypothetical protein